MITLSKADSQFVLYAKGHFGPKSNKLEQLKVLVGIRSGMSPEFITVRDIVCVLTIVANNCNLAKSIADTQFIERVIFGFPCISEEGAWEESERPAFRYSCAILSLFSLIEVLDGENNKLINIHPIDENTREMLSKVTQAALGEKLDVLA